MRQALRTIRWQMVLVVSLVSAIIVGTFGLVLYQSIEDSERKVADSQIALTRHIAEEVDSKVFGAIAMLDSLSHRLAGNMGSRAAMADLLGRVEGRSTVFDCGLFASGRTPSQPVGVDDRFSVAGSPDFAKWFGKPLTMLEPVVSPPFVVKSSAVERSVLLIAVPVAAAGAPPAGVVGGCIDVHGKALLGGLRTIPVGHSGYFFVTAWNGRLVMHPDSRLLMRTDVHPIPAEVQDLASHGLQSAVETVDQDGVPVLSTFTKMQATGWVLGANAPLAEAYDDAYAARHSALWALVIGILFSGGVTWATMHRFLTPVDRLTARIDSIGVSADEMLEPIRIPNGGREVERLSLAFNRLIARINEGRARAALATNVYKNAREGIVVTDEDGRIVSVNDALTEITGYPAQEVIGHRPSLFRSGCHDAAFYRDMWGSLNATGSWRGEIWNRRKNGEVYPELLHISTVHDDSGTLTHYMGIFSDISDIKSAQRELETRATTDALTGLPNRVLLADRLATAVAESNRHGTALAVAMVDLDGFKQVNDTNGHHIGDRLLVEVAARLSADCRAPDTVARLGGDEFVLLLTDCPGRDAARQTLEDVVATLSRPYEVDGRILVISASIGVTLYPDDRADPDTLLRHADQAMYQAKSQGRERVHFFDAQQDRLVQGYYKMVEDVRNAVRLGQMQLYYQPQVDLVDRSIVGFEALLRWQHPFNGLLAPQRFLEDVTNSDVMIDIGEWVIATALDQMRIWRTEHGLDLQVSVNVSPRHLLHPGFVDYLSGQVARHPELPAKALEIEIVETDSISDMGRVCWTLEQGHKLGIEFAIDDFGTGYSSLSYLKTLPASTLKIDKSFVIGMLEDPDASYIIEAVVQLGRVFGRRVIAEGVETRRHFPALVGLGCRLGQGFGIARPMPAAAVPTWIRQWSGVATG